MGEREGVWGVRERNGMGTVYPNSGHGKILAWPVPLAIQCLLCNDRLHSA